LLREHTRAEWVARFNAAGVPCAPVNTVPEALEDSQVQALKMQSLVPGEDFVLTALPISFDGQRPAHRSVAPRLGQHNKEFEVPEKINKTEPLDFEA
jgi:formyl-CoA transferase